MSNHENQEVLERFFEEELEHAEKRWPKLSQEQLENIAAYLAEKRFEEVAV